MSKETLPNKVTKQSFRQKVWHYIIKHKLVHFPARVYDCIPKFKGAADAAQRLSQLDEFKRATIIMINPDKTQEQVRLLALAANKEILLPVPKLISGMFLHVASSPDTPKEKLGEMPDISDLIQVGKPFGVDSNIKVDLIVFGSVCVSRDGYRLGRGKGYADMDFALLMRMGAVTQDTVIATTVHDCQIVDELPPELFKEHDVPVDIIVTPTQTIYVNPRLAKPTAILWHMISEEKLSTMHILKQLRDIDEKDGKNVTLKEKTQDHKSRPNNMKSKKRFKLVEHGTDDTAKGSEENREAKPRAARKRNSKKLQSQSPNNVPQNEEKQTENENKQATQRSHRKRRPKSNSKIEFMLKLSNISGVGVRDLKKVLQERGVKPSKIIWQGYRGVCYLRFNKLRDDGASAEEPIQVDSIISKLQQLCIGKATNNEDDFIRVKPANPISRIEVTNVTTV